MSEFLRRKAQARRGEGQAALARGELAAAELAFEHAMRLDPEPVEGWLAWADVLAQQGKRIEASRVLERACALHRDPTLELASAHAHAEVGRFALAEAMLLDLRRRWPDEREPIMHLARVLRDTRKWTRLAALIDEALAGACAGEPTLAALRERLRDWQDGGAPTQTQRAPGLRERLLVERGCLLLGTGYDDGEHVPWYSTYLASERDVAVTCARLLAYAEHFDWTWQTIAAADAAAHVLALLLARALDVGCLSPRELAEVHDFDPRQTLAVASVLSPTDALSERVLACAELGHLFAFAVLDHHAHTRLPALVGLAGGERICVPWHRLGEARIGFSPHGLITPLPDEVDERPAGQLAELLLPRVLEQRRVLGPGVAAALRWAFEQRAHLHAGLREPGKVARIPTLHEDAPRELPSLLAALIDDDLAQLEAVLAAHEHALDRIGARELDALEARFRTTPSLRRQLADLIYRVAPTRLAALLEAMLEPLAARRRPAAEREVLVAMLGSSPWGAPTRLVEWLGQGSVAERCELIGSKYALHRLAEHEGPAFGATLERLLDDARPLVVATLQWLQDNPSYAPLERVVGLVGPEFADPDVVREALVLLRIAGHPPPEHLLEPLLDRGLHPSLRGVAIELLELYPLEHAHARLDAILREGGRHGAWSAATTLLRVGRTLDERVAGAAMVARWLAELTDYESPTGRVLRVFEHAAHLEQFAELFSRTPTLTKFAAVALSESLLELGDPRAIELLRAHPLEFGLDPPHGLARFLLEHGDPVLDHALARAAEGARDLWGGYEAKALLARWGDREAEAELARALDYPPSRSAALYAYVCVLERDEPERLAAWRDADGNAGDVAWRIVRDRALRGSDAGRERLAAQLAGDGRWRHFIEVRLRAQVPGPYTVGGQAVEFEVFARALPSALDSLIDRTLSGTPDRFALDLLEWLARTRGELARTWAEQHVDSGHFAMRSAARRIVAGARNPQRDQG